MRLTMQIKRWIFIAIIVCAVTPMLYGQYIEFVYDGIIREYAVTEPSLNPNPDGYPLVIGLHGGGSNCAEFILATFLGQKANQEKFIIVAPNALRHSQYPLVTRWNAGDGYEVATDSTDDVGFISALIDTNGYEL